MLQRAQLAGRLALVSACAVVTLEVAMARAGRSPPDIAAAKAAGEAAKPRGKGYTAFKIQQAITAGEAKFTGEMKSGRLQLVEAFREVRRPACPINLYDMLTALTVRQDSKSIGCLEDRRAAS